jgi:hypothetical protein
MVTSNGLVSCVTSLDKKLQPSMTSTGICVHFSTRANLYCHTISLSIKHANVLELRSVWASIVTSLLNLTTINTKKHGVGSKDRLGPLLVHDASKSNLVILIETRHVHFLTPFIVDW